MKGFNLLKTKANMLKQGIALMIGLLAVMWYFDDTETALGSLKKKRVLVTGASAGIGEQLAYQFAAHGSHVTITARTRSALQRVAKHCSSLSPSNQSHHVIVADMKNLEKTKDVVEEAANKMGGLDILVLNHILPHPIQPFKGDQQALDLLATLLDVNFGSYVHLTSHALPFLSSSKGRVVVINSLMGKISSPLLASYSATKHALDGFFSSLRSQFLFTGLDIGVTSCFLGYIGTDSAIKGVQTAGQSRIEKWVKPAGPTDTARAIVLAAARGQDELYYPWLNVRPVALVYSVWPSLVDWIMRFISAKG